MYSPISPMNSRISPEKKKIDTITLGQPSAVTGRTIFRTITPMIPISPASENT